LHGAEKKKKKKKKKKKEYMYGSLLWHCHWT
jgi:hypothetical protein